MNIARLDKVRGGVFSLRVFAHPQDREPLETIDGINGIRAAHKVCKDRGLQPWNF